MHIKDNPDRRLIYFVLLVVFVLVLALALCIAGLYYQRFSANGLSGDPAAWGAFGDYFGGTLNPIISLFTIVILVVTLHLNSQQLMQSRLEVELSQKALKVAMDELKRGQELQEITEKGLRDQIEAITKQNDMASAVNLYKYWQECRDQANEFAQVSRHSQERDKYIGVALEHSVKQGELAKILWDEHERLIIKYGTGLRKGPA